MQPRGKRRDEDLSRCHFVERVGAHKRENHGAEDQAEPARIGAGEPDAGRGRGNWCSGGPIGCDKPKRHPKEHFRGRHRKCKRSLSDVHHDHREQRQNECPVRNGFLTGRPADHAVHGDIANQPGNPTKGEGRAKKPRPVATDRERRRDGAA